MQSMIPLEHFVGVEMDSKETQAFGNVAQDSLYFEALRKSTELFLNPFCTMGYNYFFSSL